MTPDMIQIGIYVALALGGYVLRHVNVLRHQTPDTSHPLLDRLLDVLNEQADKALDDAARRMIQPKQ
jgi:hypothetical protein